MTLTIYQDKFRRLKVNVSAGRASPHKIPQNPKTPREMIKIIFRI